MSQSGYWNRSNVIQYNGNSIHNILKDFRSSDLAAP